MIFLPKTAVEQSGVFWTWLILTLMALAVIILYFIKGKKNIKNKIIIPQYEPPAVSPFMANFLYVRSGNSDFLPEIYSTQDQLIMLISVNNKGFFKKFNVVMKMQDNLEIYWIEYIISEQYSLNNFTLDEQKFVELFKKFLKPEGTIVEEIKGENIRGLDYVGGFKEFNKFWGEIIIFTEKLAWEEGYLENKVSKFIRLYANILGLPYFLMFISMFIVNLSKLKDSLPITVKVMALPITIIYYCMRYVTKFFGPFLIVPANWFFRMEMGVYFVFLFSWIILALPSVAAARSIAYIFTDVGKQVVWKLVGYGQYLQTANHEGVIWRQEVMKDSHLIPWLMIFENDSRKRFVI